MPGGTRTYGWKVVRLVKRAGVWVRGAKRETADRLICGSCRPCQRHCNATRPRPFAEDEVASWALAG